MDLMSLENECFQYSNRPIMHAIVKTESAFNPFAIGVVNGQLARQPSNKEEAIATAMSLEKKGFNYSMGLAQVNRVNLAKYGLNHTTVFDSCTNIKIGSLIFNECNKRAIKKFGHNQTATNAALSCYYSGNFTRGQQREGHSPGYVEKVTLNLKKQNLIFGIPIKNVRITKSNEKKPIKISKQNNGEPIDLLDNRSEQLLIEDGRTASAKMNEVIQEESSKRPIHNHHRIVGYKRGHMMNVNSTVAVDENKRVATWDVLQDFNETN